ncbi:MAG: bifunctional 4-hydroxy-2-oxoglutarate aldolase/2-dehydro-3-deoxy-phosphogluconate aldolase [Erysipelotrichaceae bacterium]|nr:bifunctional 4-hydroxy-2-oxoglutarate aldolase/2-dehydro-3-deoxy-phosphogluconate aldolase [Erysipelotrichaceae bacterium]
MGLSKVTMILRGYNLDQVRNVAEVLLHAKFIKNMEITLNTDNAYEIIRAIAKDYQGRLNVGAGTVQTYDELVNAIEAGAKFVLSPRRMTKDMLAYCNENDIISVPGSFTPSEIGEQFELGANIVKVFPANELSLSYAKKVREPMGDLKLMAVGGINKSNVKEALDSGYQYVGTAGGLFAKEQIINKDFEGMLKSLKEFEAELE